MATCSSSFTVAHSTCRSQTVREWSPQSFLMPFPCFVDAEQALTIHLHIQGVSSIASDAERNLYRTSQSSACTRVCGGHPFVGLSITAVISFRAIHGREERRVHQEFWNSYKTYAAPCSHILPSNHFHLRPEQSAVEAPLNCVQGHVLLCVCEGHAHASRPCSPGL